MNPFMVLSGQSVTFAPWVAFAKQPVHWGQYLPLPSPISFRKPCMLPEPVHMDGLDWYQSHLNMKGKNCGLFFVGMQNNVKWMNVSANTGKVIVIARSSCSWSNSLLLPSVVNSGTEVNSVPKDLIPQMTTAVSEAEFGNIPPQWRLVKRFMYALWC